MEVLIKNAADLSNPKNRVLAIEAATKAICDQVGEDAADGVMMLLTAAVHIATRHSKKPIGDTALHMAEALGSAIVAADDFFKLREVHSTALKNGYQPGE
jgi:hypothetical protein